MISQPLIWFYILLTIVLANLPWFSSRGFGFARLNHKPLALYLVEIFVLFLIVLMLGFGLEAKVMGNLHAQDWEFYATMLALFFTFSTPGFLVWLYRR